MNTLSNERLEQLASGDAWACVQDDEGAAMARELLALRKEREAAVSVGEVIERPCCGTMNIGRMYKKVRGLRKMEEMPVGTKFYAAPPAQPVAVPDAPSLITDIRLEKAFLWIDGVIRDNPKMKEAKTCRAAMLKEAK